MEHGLAIEKFTQIHSLQLAGLPNTAADGTALIPQLVHLRNLTALDYLSAFEGGML